MTVPSHLRVGLDFVRARDDLAREGPIQHAQVPSDQERAREVGELLQAIPGALPVVAASPSANGQIMVASPSANANGHDNGSHS